MKWIIILSVNGLNFPIKRHTVAKWIKNQDPTTCCLQDNHLIFKDTHRMKVKRGKKIFHANGNQKRAGVALLISNKIDFKSKKCHKRQRGH